MAAVTMATTTTMTMEMTTMTMNMKKMGNQVVGKWVQSSWQMGVLASLNVPPCCCCWTVLQNCTVHNVQNCKTAPTAQCSLLLSMCTCCCCWTVLQNCKSTRHPMHYGQCATAAAVSSTAQCSLHCKTTATKLQYNTCCTETVKL